jgi:hypothetical protein
VYKYIPSPTRGTLINVSESDGITLPTDPLEQEKLLWLNPITPEEENTSSLRFNFHGVIIPSDTGSRDCLLLHLNNNDNSLLILFEEMPMHAGLHHHGKESGAAGYTLEELLLLTRSQVSSQRAIALQTLAAIIRNAKCCRHGHGVNGSFISSLQIQFIYSFYFYSQKLY